MRSSLIRKVAAGFLVALPVLLVLEVFQYRVLLKLIHTCRGAAQSSEFLRESDAVLSVLEDAETGSRVYLNMGDAGALKAAQAAVDAGDEKLEALRRRGARSSRHQAQLQKIEPLIRNALDALRKAIDLRMQERSRGEKAKPVELSTPSLRADLRKVVDGFKAREMPMMAGLEADVEASASRATSLAQYADLLSLWAVALAALLLFRKAHEQRWAGVERRLQARMLETLPVGVSLTDDSGVVIYTNPAADELLGRDSGELLGRYLGNLNIEPKEERERLAEQVLERLQTEGNWRGEFVNRRKDGKTFSCFTRARSMEMAGKTYRVFVQEDGGQRQIT